MCWRCRAIGAIGDPLVCMHNVQAEMWHRYIMRTQHPPARMLCECVSFSHERTSRRTHADNTPTSTVRTIGYYLCESRKHTSAKYVHENNETANRRSLHGLYYDFYIIRDICRTKYMSKMCIMPLLRSARAPAGYSFAVDLLYSIQMPLCGFTFDPVR